MTERRLTVSLALAEADAALTVLQSVLNDKRLDKKQIGDLVTTARAAIERASSDLADIRTEMRKQLDLI